MSRVSYVMMHEQGAGELTTSIRAGLRDLVDQLVASADIERDRVVDVVLVGNPIMHHLVLGIDPTPLGTAPFTLATEEPIDAWADDIELELPHAHLHVLPCIAGHVGADTAAAVLQEGPHRGDGDDAARRRRHQRRDRARQPRSALRGVQPDRPGVRRRAAVVRSARDHRRDRAGASRSRHARTALQGHRGRRVVGRARLRGTGRDHRHHRRLRLGDHRGHRRAVPRRRDPPRRHDRRRRRRALAARRARRTHVRVRAPRRPGGELRITQNDVRAIQLAKAALHAGVRLLMDHAAISAFDSVRLAGAFGSHIDPLYALVLGLIPDCDPAIARNVGNAAGSGAVRALLSRRRARDRRRRPPDREDRDGHRARLPGPLRRRHGLPPLHRAVTVAWPVVTLRRRRRDTGAGGRAEHRRDRTTGKHRRRRPNETATSRRARGRTAGRAARHAHRSGAVPHPHAEAVRGA